MDQVINSQAGVNLAFSLARALPPWSGYIFARLAARLIASRRKSLRVRSVRTNQWVASGKQLNSRALETRVRSVFEHTARAIYELYHFNQNIIDAGPLFVVEPSFSELIEQHKQESRGLILGGMHMSSFDLGLYWVYNQWVQPLILTIPSPQGGRQREYEIRRQAGLHLVPGSASGLLEAIHELKAGGIVLTGIDHPQPESVPRPRFFGYPAQLPTHYVYMALKTQAPVAVTYSLLQTDGKYHIYASPKIFMEPQPERLTALQGNGEKVLAFAEGIIRQYPQQWSVSQPIWPDLLDHTP